MALKNLFIRAVLGTYLSTFILISLFFNPDSALAEGSREADLPSFSEFSRIVRNGDAGVLRGVYVRDIAALPVVQQPAGNPAYVSPKNGELTQFAMASEFGNTGLLAHNYLSGWSFSQLAIGQEIRLVYGDGRIQYFTVSEILRFEALQPKNPRGSFRDLETGRILTADELFRQVYGRSGDVTFQTCIEANGDLSWGRLFVVAVPREAHTRSGRHGG